MRVRCAQAKLRMRFQLMAHVRLGSGCSRAEGIMGNNATGYANMWIMQNMLVGT